MSLSSDQNSAGDTGSSTFVPAAGLLNTQAKDAKKPLFALFTQDWITLQCFIQQTLALPITQGDFETKYGKGFSDEQQVKDVITAMKNIQGLSASFGDPATLVKQLANDPSILQTPTAPDKIYTHIVWFADKLFHAAKSYNQTLASFMEMLNPANCGSPEQCLEVLKELLTGPGGLQSTAEDMVSKANALIQVLAQFELDLDPSVTTMTQYTADDSNFYNEVVNLVGQDAQDIKKYRKAAKKAHKEWVDYTIAATTTSIGVLVFSVGLAWPAAAALGGGLGAAAAAARKAYDEAEKNLHKAEKDKKKKMLLQHDLGALNDQMPDSTNAATAFKKTLQQVLGAWTNISNNISYISTTFTVDQIKDLSSAMQALKLHQATEDWQAIATASEEYTSQSLVSFDIGTFGDKLPAQPST